MADNVTVFPGSDGTAFDVAADEIAGIKHQRVKVEIGVDGTATDVSASNPMPVTGSVTVTGTATVTGSVDTELPSAAALADGVANPTAPAVGSYGMVWNGTTWERIQGTGAGGIKVDLNSGPVTLVDGTGGVNRVTIRGPAKPVAATDTAVAVGLHPSSIPFAAQPGSASQPAMAAQVAGWNGQTLQPVFVQALDGQNTLSLHDAMNRRLLEEILVEMRTINNNLARAFPIGGAQQDMRADLRLAR